MIERIQASLLTSIHIRVKIICKADVKKEAFILVNLKKTKWRLNAHVNYHQPR